MPLALICPSKKQTLYSSLSSSYHKIGKEYSFIQDVPGLQPASADVKVQKPVFTDLRCEALRVPRPFQCNHITVYLPLGLFSWTLSGCDLMTFLSQFNKIWYNFEPLSVSASVGHPNLQMILRYNYSLTVQASFFMRHPASTHFVPRQRPLSGA